MITIKEAINHYWYGISHDIFSEPVTSYAELAIEALEKQIPQRAINMGKLYGYVCRCPVCHKAVTKNMVKYCYECGQALDWSEQDE